MFIILPVFEKGTKLAASWYMLVIIKGKGITTIFIINCKKIIILVNLVTKHFFPLRNTKFTNAHPNIGLPFELHNFCNLASMIKIFEIARLFFFYRKHDSADIFLIKFIILEKP